jgi:hypothetical protein
LPAAAERRAENPLFSVEWNLYEFRDEGVCPCCPTSVALADDGSLLVAFRNEMNGYRDIWLARKEPGEEPPPLPVAVTPPRWKFDGCPHDGPSLRVVNDRFYLAFMDASSGKPRVYLTEGGFDLKGETPVEVSPRSDATQGHPCLVADAEAGLHLVWDEGMSSASHSAAPTDHEGHEGHDGHEHGDHEHDAASAGESARAIFYVQRSKEGELGTPRAVAPVKDAFQTRPAVAVSPAGDVYVAWTELSEEGRSIVVARLKEAR